MKTSRLAIALVCALLVAAVLPAAAAQAKAKPAPEAAANMEELLKVVEIRSIGPTRQSGRFIDIAVPLQQPHTFYIANASGHLWKTVNNGQSFEALFENEAVFSIGAVAVAPSDPKILYLGTGEANNSRSSYWGDGVYKSVDEGKTWTNIGLKESHHIGRIVIHPENPNIVYVAALGKLYSENPERGLYKTTDGGKTWVKSLDIVVREKHIGVVEVAMDPTNPDVLYAATYDKVRTPYTFNLAGPGSGIYKTTDAGATWTKLANGLPGGMLGRIGLAVYSKNPNIVYAKIENANKPGMSDEEREKELLEDKSSAGMIDGEIYRSDDAGASWRKVSPDKQSIGGAPGYYYGRIIVDPNDDQVIYILSVSVLMSRDGGKTWNRRAFNFGGDNHALWINPADSNHMILGYDHGLGVTWDGGKNWHHPDNIPVMQFYAIGVDNSYPYRVAGGTQDNGSHIGPSTKRGGGPIRLEDWHTVGGGDGMYQAFDWKTNRWLYNESQFGVIQRVDLVTGETKRIGYQNIRADLRWNWCAPILVSPHNSDVVYHAANILVKSPFRGEYWVEVSPDLTTNDPAKLTTGKGGDGNIQYCTITTIDESPLVEGLLWVGTDDGNVWVSRDGGGEWTKLNDNIKGNPGYWVSRVTASRHDPGTAYVTYTGYRRDDFRPFIYKTTDYGKTWTSLAANLPDAPINVVREHHRNPNLLFVGAEPGLYVSFDGGKKWMSLKNNMPTQPIHDMVIHTRENDLVIGTHGRGIFIADISPLEELTPGVMARDAHLFDIKSKVLWQGFDRRHSSYANYDGQSEPNGIVVYYHLKSKPAGDVKLQVYRGNHLINEIKAPAEAGLHKVVWNMTERKLRTAEEKKEIQERMKRFAEMGYPMRMDIDYAEVQAREGEYRFVLQAGGRTLEGRASILQDHWFDK
jgi:photosystem II stability/assembly factor-like uncharacterized protein